MAHFDIPAGCGRNTLDTLTPFYQGCLRRLPRQPSVLLHAMLAVGRPVTHAELATLVGADVGLRPGASPQAVIAQAFTSLVDKQAVREAGSGPANAKLFEVADPVFAEWYRITAHLGPYHGAPPEVRLKALSRTPEDVVAGTGHVVREAKVDIRTQWPVPKAAAPARRPPMTLGEFRALTEGLPDDVRLVMIDPPTGGPMDVPPDTPPNTFVLWSDRFQDDGADGGGDD